MTTTTKPNQKAVSRPLPRRSTSTQHPIRLDDYLPYQITVLADRISRRTNAIVKERSHLNLSQWRVMAAIADRPGRSAQEVVAITPMDKGIVSRAVKSLIEDGHVRREASQADGRLGHLFLTAQGARVYRALAVEISKMQDLLLQTMPTDSTKRLTRDVRMLVENSRTMTDTE